MTIVHFCGRDQWEAARLGPESPRFPHVYGSIPVDAVVAIHDFQPGADGTFAPRTVD
jgi:uncharacterized protein (DUF952 family)